MSRPVISTPSLPSVVTRILTCVEDLLAGEAGLGLEQRALVVVGQQVVRAADQGQHVAAVHPGELLRRVGGERVAAVAALLRVADHRGRVVRADQHQVEAAGPGGDRGQLDVARLGHRAGVERRDLVEVVVGGADEAGGVRDLADVHRAAVDAVPLEPGPVVGEVGADRADQDRAQAELAHAEGDVRWPRRRAGRPGRRRGRRARPCATGRR